MTIVHRIVYLALLLRLIVVAPWRVLARWGSALACDGAEFFLQGSQGLKFNARRWQDKSRDARAGRSGQDGWQHKDLAQCAPRRRDAREAQFTSILNANRTSRRSR